MIADLHTHTTASDGSLDPAELCVQAAAAGIELLSITDHDTVDAFAGLKFDRPAAPRIAPGVEFSTQWEGCGIHVLGLNIDPASDAIAAATEFQAEARLHRAAQIAERLERLGARNVLGGAQAIAGRRTVGRPHIAQHLVESGFVKDPAQAFNRYLGAGKIGDVKQHWAPLETIIAWIRAAGGIAVLAHPGKYGLTRTRRNKLIAAFTAHGGQGLEVISGQQDPALTAALAAAANAHGLLASAGSDFHRPKQAWARLGMPLNLPPDCRPVWDRW